MDTAGSWNGWQGFTRNNNEEAPASLQDIDDAGYVYLDDVQWPGKKLVYRRLKRDAPASAVMAYYWPPTGGGMNVVFKDAAVQWVSIGQDGKDRDSEQEGQQGQNIICAAHGTSRG